MKHNYYFYCCKCDTVSVRYWDGYKYFTNRGNQSNMGMKICCDNSCGNFAERVFEEYRKWPCSHGSAVQRKIQAIKWYNKPLLPLSDFTKDKLKAWLKKCYRIDEHGNKL